MENASRKKFELVGSIYGRRLIAEARFGDDSDWTLVGGRHFYGTDLRSMHKDPSLPVLDDKASGIRLAADTTLLEHAQAEESSAVVVLKNGKVTLERYREGYDGEPILAMSATKSVVSLAVGMLITDGKLTLDTRMGDLFPEWRAQGSKGAITIRHLLSHTSGLDPRRADYGKETIRERGVAAELLSPPGRQFQYNNAAIDLLALVVKQAAGVPLDQVLEERLFRKLGIVGAHWMKDKEGTPMAAGELYIRPIDLAKIGQMMLDGGAWHGEAVVSRDWVTLSTGVVQGLDEECGFLWWREGEFSRALTEQVLATWKELGVDGATAKKARSLLGRRFASRPEYRSALEHAVGKPAYVALLAVLDKAKKAPAGAVLADGPAMGYSARGWLGQYLIVLPKAGVVAVRMREDIYSDHDGGEERRAYSGFSKDVSQLF